MHYCKCDSGLPTHRAKATSVLFRWHFRVDSCSSFLLSPSSLLLFQCSIDTRDPLDAGRRVSGPWSDRSIHQSTLSVLEPRPPRRPDEHRPPFDLWIDLGTSSQLVTKPLDRLRRTQAHSARRRSPPTPPLTGSVSRLAQAKERRQASSSKL